jgi:hypothetical protein
MKKLFFIPFIIFFVFLSYSCGVPESDNSAVVLDGPILEGVGKDGNIEFNGAVMNASSESVRNVYVVIILKDENGKIIEANSVNVLGDEQNVLLPSESSFFTVTFSSEHNNVHTKEVEIYYDNNESALPDDDF